MKTIHEKLDELGDNLGRLRTEIAVLRRDLHHLGEDLPAVERRVSTLETWRWRVVGAAGVLALVSPPVWGLVIKG